jgi:hypothetical protein
VSEAELRPTRYEIVVRDRLSARFNRVFPGLELTPQPGRTILTGDFVDQSQLHGTLDRLRDFGIELVSINVIE